MSYRVIIRAPEEKYDDYETAKEAAKQFVEDNPDTKVYVEDHEGQLLIYFWGQNSVADWQLFQTTIIGETVHTT